MVNYKASIQTKCLRIRNLMVGLAPSKIKCRIFQYILPVIAISLATEKLPEISGYIHFPCLFMKSFMPSKTQYYQIECDIFSIWKFNSYLFSYS